MGNLKEFMLIFRISKSEYTTVKENDAVLHQEWKKYIAMTAAKVKLVNVSRLSDEAVVISEQSVENKISDEDDLSINGNLTLKSETIEEVILIAKKCPILLIGGTVEVRKKITIK